MLSLKNFIQIQCRTSKSVSVLVQELKQRTYCRWCTYETETQQREKKTAVSAAATGVL